MASTTTNLGLIKPELTDNITPTIFAENFDKIDTAVNGKAAKSHNQAASTVTEGTLAGKVLANATAQATLADAQLRNVIISDTNLTAGTSALASGTIYIYYT